MEIRLFREGGKVMVLETQHFGNIEISEEDIIEFERGLPGFEDNKRFTILEKVGDDNPFKWLQSIDSNTLAFVIVQPQMFKDHYEVKIDDNVAAELELEDVSEVIVYSIVTIPQEISKMTANLKAPILINAKKNKGCQMMLDDERYQFKHGILQELQNMGGK